jgi:hypothetical protein
LKLRQKELDDATRVADEIESRLAAVRKDDVSLKAELIDAKNEFENLKVSRHEKSHRRSSKRSNRQTSC